MEDKKTYQKLDEGKIKDIFNKVKKAIKREKDETQLAIALLIKKYYKKKPLTKNEEDFIKAQGKDFSRLIPLMAAQAIPVPLPITPALIALGKKFGFSILPTSHQTFDISDKENIIKMKRKELKEHIKNEIISILSEEENSYERITTDRGYLEALVYPNNTAKLIIYAPAQSAGYPERKQHFASTLAEPMEKFNEAFIMNELREVWEDPSFLKNDVKELLDMVQKKTNLQEVDYIDKWKMVGTLVTNTKERPQNEILSDIRSLTGVTVVSTADLDDSSSQRNENLRTKMTVKIDGYPFIRHGGFGKKSIKSIIAAIKRVKGVKTYLVNPENIKRL